MVGYTGGYFVDFISKKINKRYLTLQCMTYFFKCIAWIHEPQSLDELVKLNVSGRGSIIV
ncbi:MAG: hypothetical protein RL757_151 [Bacteroidota bacterium]|jgi:hypothetical protein